MPSCVTCMPAEASAPSQGSAAGAALEALRGHELLVAGTAVSAGLLAVLEGAGLWLVLPLLQSLNTAGPDAIARLRHAVLLVALVVVLRAGAGYLNAIAGARLLLTALIGLRESLVASLYRTRHEVLRAMGAGHIVNLFSTQTERIVTAIGALSTLLTAVLLLVVYGAAMAMLSWRVTAVVAAVGFAGFALARAVTAGIRARALQLAFAQDESMRLIVDDVEGMHVIQAFAAGPARLERHRAANRALFHHAMRVHRVASAVGPATAAFYGLLLLAGLLTALTLAGDRLLGNLPLVVAFGVVLLRVHGQLVAAADAWAMLAEQEGAAASLHVVTSGSADSPDGERAPASPVGLVDVAGVEFRYAADTAHVLEGLDLELMRGQVLALVGPSGSGKSTLAALLVRLRLPGAGRIRLDDVALDGATRDALARRVGIVFQDGFVFDEPVLWNVMLGRDAAPETLREALRASGLGDLIEARSAKALSGGQRQRVALARALLGAPDILVLDEATSALDAAAERVVLESLRALRRDRITLLIAHRLSTVLAADRIAVLDGGRIVDTGRHEDLLETSPVYRRLVETQLVEVASVR